MNHDEQHVSFDSDGNASQSGDGHNVYQDIFNATREAIFIIDASSSEIIDVNASMLHMFGYDAKEEVLHHNIGQLSAGEHPYSQEVAIERLNKTLLEGPQQFEWLARRKNGETFWVDVSLSKVIIGGQTRILSMVRDINNEKTAREAFMRKQNLFEQMFVQSSISTQILDHEGWCVRINPKLTESFGVEPQHIEGKVYNIFQDEAIKQGGIIPYLEKVFYEGEPATWEVYFDIGLAADSQNIEIKEKKRVWFRNWAFPIFDENKQLQNVIIQHTDITKEKQNLESLKNSDRIFNHALDMICIAGYDGFFKVLNPAWSAVLGWSNEELLSHPWIEFVHPDDREGTANARTVLIDGKSVYQFENRYICKDGSVKWLSWNSYPYPDEEVMFGVARDITDKIREEIYRKISYDVSRAVVYSENLEQLIIHIRKRLSSFVETPNFYIALYDEATGLLSLPYEVDEKDSISTWPAERSATGMVIKSRQPLLLKKEDVDDLIDTGLLDMIGTPSAVWLGVPLFDGDRVIGALAMQHYDNPNAFDQGTVAILEFIAGQISLAMQRKRIVDELVKAKEKAEESDRLKTSFLNNLSHEIRTPLNAIVGFSQFLNEPNLSPERTSHITNIICASSDQLLAIINDIVNISTIEAGIMEVNLRKANVNTILHSVHEQLKHKATSKNIDLVFKCNLSEKEAAIEVDETKLTQVLINLIDNAIKFTHEGVVECRCSGRDGRLQFSVADTGIGIPTEMHEVVFKRFHQVENDATAVLGGLGLGLPIAKSFIELMGGKIWLESSQGTGTRFYFNIPVNRIETEAAEPEYKPDSVSGEKHLVLVAEDEENNFELTRVILSSLGMEVLHAWNGEEAVNMCAQNMDIGLVLMDIKMPVMNGFEATPLIKAGRPDLPVVALTAYALLGDREKAISAGCDDYLSKPVSLSDFQKMVYKYLP